MPHRRGTFREDIGELLERFAHKGTPHLFEEAEKSGRLETNFTTQCPIFRLNQSLFETADEKRARQSKPPFGRGTRRR